MKRLLPLLLLLAVGQAQVLEATIRLGHPSKWLFPVPGHGKLYVIAQRRDSMSTDTLVLYSVDCATNSITDSIVIGSRNVGSECGAYDWRTHKFYTRGGPASENLVVIDVDTDSVLRRLALPNDHPTRQCFAYNGTTGRLYVAANGPTHAVGVLDCAADSFVKWIPDAGVATLTWDSVGNKLYACSWLWGADEFIVTDCVTESIADTVRNCPRGYYATAYSRRNRLYTCGDFGDIGIVNTLTDSVVFRVPVQVSLKECVVCNEHEDKVYAGARSNSSSAYDSVYVLDCLGDTVLHRRVGLDGSAYIDWVALAPWSNRLYCTTSQGRLFAVDCSTDSVVGVAEYSGAGGGSGYIVCHPDNHRIYVARWGDYCVYVYRDEPNGVTEPQATTPPPCRPGVTWYRSGDGIVIVLGSPASGRLSADVYDLSGRSVRTLGTTVTGSGPCELYWDATSRTGTRVAPGVYFVSVRSADATHRVKVVLQ